MNSLPLTSWGQIGLCLAGAVTMIIFAVGHLFRTMGASYGSIIVALQKQNAEQQLQIDELKRGLAANDRACEAKLEALRTKHEEDIRSLNDKISLLQGLVATKN